jgi:probable phosphoglycerate mutase
MDMIFARHGNTFAPGDKVVWVGRETDLPLVDRGREQAHEVADALIAAGLVPTAIFCASLRRTRLFAEIVAEAVCPEVLVTPDRRLDEVDYGAWAGLSSEEIAAMPGGAAAAKAWQDSDTWPKDAGWRTTREEVQEALESFLEDLPPMGRTARRLFVSSNGILRFLPRILGVADGRGSFSMKTGHVGWVQRGPDGRLRLVCWNVPPAQLPRLAAELRAQGQDSPQGQDPVSP